MALSSPGISIEHLLLSAKTRSILSLLPKPTVDLIDRMSPGLLLTPEVNQVAVAVIDPKEALENPAKRTTIIRLLPIEKARELCAKLELEVERSPYNAIEVKIAETGVQPLYDFFGIIDDPHAPRAAASNPQPVPASYGLFPHQRIAARKVANALAHAPRKVILHMPTGAGKTRTAMHLVARHLREFGPTVVVWLAQNRELLEQASDEFDKAWQPLGDRDVQLIRFWGNRRAAVNDLHDGIMIAGLAKMASLDTRDVSTLLSLADRASLTVIDEAHQAIAPTYANVLKALSTKRPENALLGLTATPGRSWSEIEEDKRLSNFFDGQKVLLEVEDYDDPVSFLMEEGYLARPEFKQIEAPSDLHFEKSEQALVEDEPEISDEILEKLGRDAARTEAVLGTIVHATSRHDRIIVFAPSVENARLLQAMLTIKNIEALFVSGETEPFERSRRIRRYKSNAKNKIVMLNFGVLTTGFDAPQTSCAIIARPTRSLVLYSQMVGRATRGTRAGGNETAEIITVTDPALPGFGSVTEAFSNWEDVWHEPTG
ncbi:MAG: DEAD/DEAH box helicase [Pseudomonadota bacterium]